MSKCTLILRIADTTIVHELPRKEALKLAIKAAQTSKGSSFNDEIVVREQPSKDKIGIRVIAFDLLPISPQWFLSCASGASPGELEALGYDWKAARDARIAAGGAW